MLTGRSAAEELPVWTIIGKHLVDVAGRPPLLREPRCCRHVEGMRETAGVFNICGNKYRLIAAIHYNRQRLYVLGLLRHAEYSKDFWKGTL